MGLTVVFIVLITLVALVAIAMQPADFRISRSRTIAAAPSVLHAQVNDFHRWSAWSPWEKLDPDLKRDYAGPAEGVGAAYHWVGNPKVGEGRMTITDSRAPESITILLEFLKPWKATNTTQFDFRPEGAGTHVTWSMTGRNNFMMKAFALFMNMDKMVGPDFEKGLAGLDAIATSPR